SSSFASRVYMRSLATRQSNLSVSKYIADAVNILKAAAYDLIILETSGIGQSDTAITDFSDVSLYVMTPEYGAASQLEKIDMLDFADVIALNKFDKRGALDALRDIKKQYKRNHNLWEAKDEELPVFGTIASQFNDPGMNQLYVAVIKTIADRTGVDLKSTFQISEGMSEKIFIIPPNRTRYLSEISESVRNYNAKADAQSEIAGKLYGIKQTIEVLEANGEANTTIIESIQKAYEELELSLDGRNKKILTTWKSKVEAYAQDEYIYTVRNKEIRVPTYTTSLSHTRIPRVSLPRFKSWGEILRWVLQENVPGEYPYTSGVFPFKRKGEDPTRMFAGEGNPERTNRRFHYVSLNMPAHRLSTAFDSVTLYGDDPNRRPDIYGKIGNAGVNIC
ncbi:MAG TPA: hypothetical protein EYO58_12895, partial [Flavobacteriales bacterium]|nr:hypothetical protein [Flavobacteriales bacterium]